MSIIAPLSILLYPYVSTHKHTPWYSFIPCSAGLPISRQRMRSTIHLAVTDSKGCPSPSVCADAVPASIADRPFLLLVSHCPFDPLSLYYFIISFHCILTYTASLYVCVHLYFPLGLLLDYFVLLIQNPLGPVVRIPAFTISWLTVLYYYLLLWL